MERLSQVKEREIAAISARHGRRRVGKTLVEGVRAIATMLDCGVRPEYIVVSPSKLTDEGEKFLSRLSIHDLLTYDCEAKRFAKLSDTVNSQGFLAVLKTDFSQIDDELLQKSRFAVYLDGINDPGNLGTIIRTAAAFAVDFIAVSPNSADFFNPKTIRASAGLVFKLPLERVETPADFFAKLAANGIIMLGGASEASVDLSAVIVGEKTCLAIGSEATGLSPETRLACQILFRIRMAATVESLNAASAAAIALHKIAMKQELI